MLIAGSAFVRCEEFRRRQSPATSGQLHHLLMRQRCSDDCFPGLQRAGAKVGFEGNPSRSAVGGGAAGQRRFRTFPPWPRNGELRHKAVVRRRECPLVSLSEYPPAARCVGCSGMSPPSASRHSKPRCCSCRAVYSAKCRRLDPPPGSAGGQVSVSSPRLTAQGCHARHPQVCDLRQTSGGHGPAGPARK